MSIDPNVRAVAAYLRDHAHSATATHPTPHSTLLDGESFWDAVARAANPKWRIALAGFSGEHDELHERHGWRVVEWYRGGFLKGGMGNTGGTDEDGTVGHQQHMERLWLSPGFLAGKLDQPAQTTLWGAA